MTFLLSLFLAVAPASAQSLPRAEAALPAVIHPEGGGRGGAISQRARDSHFYVRAQVNGAVLPMMVDTGAGMVSLRYEDAGKAGIDTGALSYSVVTSTPNGRVNYAPVVLATLAVGEITRSNVRALVAPPGKLAVNLLGQTFLTRIGGIRQEGDTMTLAGTGGN